MSSLRPYTAGLNLASRVHLFVMPSLRHPHFHSLMFPGVFTPYSDLEVTCLIPGWTSDGQVPAQTEDISALLQAHTLHPLLQRVPHYAPKPKSIPASHFPMSTFLPT